MSWLVYFIVYFKKRLTIFYLLVMLVATVFYLFTLVFDSILLTRKNDWLASKLEYYSFMTEKLKMRKTPKVWNNDYSSERVDNEMTALLIENDTVFNISILEEGRILIDIKNINFSRLLDVVLILSYYQDIEINNININRTNSEDGSDILNGIICIKRLSKGM
ncbi:hypothetical protein KEM40_13175 [Yersinia sp. Marseille-Q3913]|uniref:hypothetical protein n=2 Tax=Yersinia sp. Marseille-Q3913 TaxID=2830769 RepID=UPI001BC3C10D|nr:hypothetical protein [Yersinia sp. Marseille-Q3913]